MIALRRDEPHWMLNDADARVYGQALQNALRHIPIQRAQKTLDFAMLVVAACQFEIPRIYMSNQITKARRQGVRPAAVFPFRQPSPSPAGSPPPAGAGGASSAGNGASGARAQEDMTIEPEFDEPRFGPQ